MLNSAPDLSASRWAPHNRGRTSSPYHTNSLPTNHSHGHHITNSTPYRQPSPTKSQTAPTSRRSPTRNPTLTPAQQRRQSLTLYARLFLRLKWRASLLLTAHAFALSPDTHGTGLTPTDSDTQFRIDFFEFYVLLERTLLHLLNAVGVRVSATYNPANDTTSSTPGPNSTQSTNGLHYAKPNPPLIGDSKNLTPKHGHAFHQNLLAALSTPDNNPLYPLLGTGQVREYIGLAKDLRNSWKDSTTINNTSSSSTTTTTTASTSAHLPHSHHSPHTAQQVNTDANGGLAVEAAAQEALQERLHRRYAQTLKELRLDEMLRVVLGRVEEAGGVAERAVGEFEVEEAARVDGRRVSMDMLMDQDVSGGGGAVGGLGMGPIMGVGVGMGTHEGRGAAMRGEAGERPWESVGVGAGWEGDEMEF